MALTWNEQLQKKLIAKFGNKKGLVYFEKYREAFTPAYIVDCTADVAIADINELEQLSDKNPIAVHLTLTTQPSAYPLRLRLFQWGNPIPLSDILPMLENMGLRTFNENPYNLTLTDDQAVYISEFAVAFANQTITVDIDNIRDLFQDAFIHIFTGLAENDGFNRLLLGASLSWREIMILRTYAKYLRQIGFRFSQAYIEQALDNNTAITKDLVALFLALHTPGKAAKLKNPAEKIEKNILLALEKVNSIDEDKIIRRLLDLIKASLRTNYFQLDATTGKLKDYLSIKLNSRHIPEIPQPAPLYEIFVYSPRFEGVHLRNAKVARGGIRWSDRREDFRTEILGLEKAQTVKNSVIVPSVAKGGFVLKTTPMPSTREALQAEVVFCYKSFIRGLLDLTDNIVNKKIISPKNVVCYDDNDPYLVVAADKGTATFSDIANSISLEYNFWLGDAFASGGSAGYDHKKIGITARGAWESIKRHFRELNIDQPVPISR